MKNPYMLPGECHFDRISSFLAQYLIYCHLSFCRGELTNCAERGGGLKGKMLEVKQTASQV